MHKHNIHYSRLREGIMSNIIERYKGFKKRFKKCPKKPIILKENKAIYIEYGEFIRNDEKQTFKITLDGKPSYNKIDVPYQIVFGQERLMYSKVNAAGYLSFRKNCWIFTVAAKNIPIKWKYKPIQAECRDSGRNPWQARPNGQKIQIPKEIEDVCNQIKELNQLIPVGNKQKILEEQGIEINSGYRQKLRRKWLKAHRQLDNLTRKYAQQEVNEAVKNRAVIGIDGVAVGVSTWGQDHYYKWLMTLAQNQSIPHLLINPAYSSRTCNDCGYRNPKKNRKSVDILYCEKCNKEKDAQINAAKNMTQQTWKIWKSLS